MRHCGTSSRSREQAAAGCACVITPRRGNVTFLGLNGKAIDCPEGEVVAVMLALAAGELTEDGLADWLRSRTADRTGA